MHCSSVIIIICCISQKVYLCIIHFYDDDYDNFPIEIYSLYFSLELFNFYYKIQWLLLEKPAP